MTSQNEELIFSSEIGDIRVTRSIDKILSFKGEFEDCNLQSVIPVHKNCCVILLDPDASRRPVFENLLCINKVGHILWRAKLKTNPDVFVEINIISDGIEAKTWSGRNVVFDITTGHEKRSTFVK